MFLPGARKVFIIIFCKNILLDIFQFINQMGFFSLFFPYHSPEEGVFREGSQGQHPGGWDCRCEYTLYF